VILADTSVWIDFLRGSRRGAGRGAGSASGSQMQSLLAAGRIVMHPFVVGEIALGSLHNRQQTFSLMESLWQVKVAELAEVRQMIEAHSLYSRGLGLIDVHLLASCLLTPGTRLWTRDAELHKAAKALGVEAVLP
jgi:predicted nucleic acid-binding protein